MAGNRILQHETAFKSHSATVLRLLRWLNLHQPQMILQSDKLPLSIFWHCIHTCNCIMPSMSKLNIYNCTFLVNFTCFFPVCFSLYSHKKSIECTTPTKNCSSKCKYGTKCANKETFNEFACEFVWCSWIPNDDFENILYYGKSCVCVGFFPREIDQSKIICILHFFSPHLHIIYMWTWYNHLFWHLTFDVALLSMYEICF